MATKTTKKKKFTKKKGDDYRVIVNENEFNDPVYIVKNAPSPEDGVAAAVKRFIVDTPDQENEEFTVKFYKEGTEGEEIIITDFS